MVLSIEKLRETADFLKKQAPNFTPEIGIVLGSGIGPLADEIEVVKKIPYREIPHFPKSTVEGHAGEWIFGHLEGRTVCAMAGRFHFYEGYTLEETTRPIRVMKLLGVKTLITSNASGGVNPNFAVGDIMVITDHISLHPDHPLRGHNLNELGPRFPNLMRAYDNSFIALAEEIALKQNLTLRKGVYVAVQGPCYETPAEYQMYFRIGGDAVGMSTVPEVQVAAHMGMRVFALSVISDIGYPPEKADQVSHEFVLQIVKEAQPKVIRFIKEFVHRV